MDAKLSKKIEMGAYAAILVASIFIAVKFLTPTLQPGGAPQSSIKLGTKFAALPADWAAHEETLVMALQVGCRYCTASAPFYQRLATGAARTGKVHLVAVLPQDPARSKEYLAKLQVPVDDVRQASLGPLGVTGTPTLILVNRRGEVSAVWPGKLPPMKETELLHSLGIWD